MKTDMDNAEIFAVPFYEEDFFRNDKYECNLITKQIYYKKRSGEEQSNDSTEHNPFPLLSHIQILYAKHEMFLRVDVVVVAAADPLENNKLELNHATMEHTYNDFLMNIFPPLHLLSGLDSQ